MNTIYDAIEWCRAADTEAEKGARFERAVRFYLKSDPVWRARFSEVWLWSDAPTNDGHDIGIDLVARERDTEELWAIQCKCYADDATLDYKTVSTFYGATGAQEAYTHNMLVSTAETFSPNLDKVATEWGTVRLFPSEMAQADLDWHAFLTGTAAAGRTLFEPRPHQREAIDACLAGFRKADRGKLIMACGTGKTLTALRLAEDLCPRGRVLFLAPSIQLVSQTLRSWANQARGLLRCAVVCSDAKASNAGEDVWETSLSELPYPATTDADELLRQVGGGEGAPAPDGLTVVFSTYQSIQVVIDAQGRGLPAFDLCICDEAHRTTGVADAALSKQERSAFVKVHDAAALRAKKRLYMTATPRIYSTNAVRRAHEESFEVASMDDPATYGEELYRLSFGRAVERGLLSDYRVIVLTVSEEMASAVYQRSMLDDQGGFDVPEVAKILGCWKGLATRGERSDLSMLSRVALENGAVEDFQHVYPMKRAVAFSQKIAESKEFAERFQTVVDAYLEKAGEGNAGEDAAGEGGQLRVEAQHIDGGMDAKERKRKISWLEEPTPDQVCRVLSNAKCLAEGIDVPSLDAVMFMKPRKSQIDIIQAVGRVMRKSPGKRYGYIILPVVVPAGLSPEAALDDDKAFAVVWQILQALRSHDERLDARINSLSFGKGKGEPGSPIIVEPFDGEDEGDDAAKAVQDKLALEWTVRDWQNAMEAKLVRKCGTRVYWDDWADDVAGIASRHISRIRAVLAADVHARAEFERFLGGLRDSLNPGITETQAVEMLAQHLITLPVFEALFDNGSFAKSNPVSVAMEGMLDVLRENRIADREEDDVLQSLYDSVRSRVSVVQTAAGRQSIVKDLYEGFFSKAFKGTSEKMGIVYTPNEVVEYILRATDRMLRAEFGQGLGDAGVHVLDPFAGTGTFMAELIASDIISDEQLPYKYAHELHSNEILLLAYYIMTINIEQAYHRRMQSAEAANIPYTSYPGAVLTDTFQMTEEGDTLDTTVFTKNSDRVVQQNALDIRVIVGNPPYSAGQKSANDNNANESYPYLDSRIAATYAARTRATNKNALYDSYIRAFRWASDRIGDRGIICFVSNGGWVDGQAMNGMRECLAEEFSAVYVYHLRGNQRTQGEESRKEGGKIFGSGSRAPIAITMLVKNPDAVEQGAIYFHDIGDYLTREEKLAMVKRAAATGELEWARITPDRHGDWLNQRDDSWYEFAPLGIANKPNAVPSGLFACYSRGAESDRDAWVYNFSSEEVSRNVKKLINCYEGCRAASMNDEELVDNDPRHISWSRSLKGKLSRDVKISFHEEALSPCAYRPFCKQWLYFESGLVDYPALQGLMFPSKGEHNNKAITIAATRRHDPMPFIVDAIPSHGFDIDAAQCFPLYWYEKRESLGGLFDDDAQGGYVCHDAITDEALSVFREAYPRAFDAHGKQGPRAKKHGGVELTKEDIFFYVYGVLHSPEYRTRFAANLKKELPRIPLAADFAAFCAAGRALANLHLNYESVEPWPLEEVGDSRNPGRTTKMRFGKCAKDKEHPKGQDMSVLHVAENLVLKGIPLQAYDYVVNGKSAVGWLMDRYQVRTDKSSGIVNDPNDYSDDPRYIVDLVKRVVRVSMETLEIVSSLPPLNEKPHPATWPAAWRVE